VINMIPAVIRCELDKCIRTAPLAESRGYYPALAWATNSTTPKYSDRVVNATILTLFLDGNFSYFTRQPPQGFVGAGPMPSFAVDKSEENAA
jgi:hypothetical protein